jgi:signal transduction histidine kinase
VGRGIPAHELVRIFERFHRVEDPMTMETGGSGLGLYIARELARAMGGDIAVSSTLGEGASFAFSLPKHPGDSTRTGTYSSMVA